MLSSNSSSCNPFPEYDTAYFTSSRSQQDPNFFFAFPNSPHMHLQYDDVPCLDHFLDNFYHHQSLNTSTNTNTPATQNTAAPTSAAAAVKKDRHSKINTARGPRDRRMRLSLDIARKFFDLQDLLGYDKASRTVDWLLRSSRTAIRELARASSSCTSEDCCEAVSSSTTDKMTAAAAAATAVEASSCTKINNCRRAKRGRVQVHQKRASVGRESRKKARERARERTSQKRRLMRENSNAAAAAGTVFVMSGEDLSSDEARISGATNEGVFFNHNNHNINALFTLHQDEQIAESFQFNGKLWEAYNSFNLSG